MEFSRQDQWSGLSFPSPRDLPSPGIQPRSPVLQADSLLSEQPGKARKIQKIKNENFLHQDSSSSRNLSYRHTYTHGSSIYTQIFTELFLTAKDWKQPWYPPVKDWLNNYNLLHTRTPGSHSKRMSRIHLCWSEAITKMYYKGRREAMHMFCVQKMVNRRDFPSGPVVKTLPFQC